MRALFVAPYLPTPGSGGRSRLIGFMSRLARRHDLSLVAFTAPDQDPAEAPYPGSVVRPPPRRPRPGGVRGVAIFYRERLERLPAFVSWMRHPAMTSAVREAVARFRPDVVQVETTEMAQYLPAVPPGPVRALDLQDVASRWFGRIVDKDQTRQQRAMMALELAKTRRYERRMARIPEVVFVSSGVERAFLRELSGVDAVEVPNGVDTAAFAAMPSEPEDGRGILFVGPLTYDANIDGLRWFSAEVLPLVLAEEPGAHLEVVGTAVDEPFPERVRLAGWVPDVRPHLARAPLSVVPVRLGSGTRYKILEALSMERAVVSTTLGAEGLGVRDGEHLLLADAPEDFARAVVRLLRSPEERARLGRAGRAHVVGRYDWEPLVARLESSWEAAAGRRASTR